MATGPPINRAQYAAAQQRIRDGIWRVHPELGRIWSNRRKDWVGAVRKRAGYVYLPTPVSTGRQLYVVAHRVIWEFVHSPVPDEFEVNHINGNKADNRINNLELVTTSGNAQHAYSLDLRKATVGATNGMSKLTDPQVTEIRLLLNNGVLQGVIARQFGISPAAISLINTGKRWAHLPEGVE